MKVWIVEWKDDYTPNELYGVFSSIEKAIEFRSTLDWFTQRYVEIQELELDVPCG